ncbi:MAG: biotin transporter BioY [Rothia sp. (in: high G+C Gram-positive bacteria)]|uniref:biotin transporter BioY n=1 Tax=Rothia sp. (in: high G+C Gram-positive bacteria) TaxID=1885016 RepID=UPI0026DF460E|nr:biotin transporter BioY [Rothia sp. (in: high G+C Gram-positive bacteria)]MDO5750709.1 biotin transporter BioY [Rothia sp. (in: high G+C Gram-positive bacteria)]
MTNNLYQLSASQLNERPRGNAGRDLALIAVFAAFIGALSILPSIAVSGAVPFTFQTLAIYITAQVLGGVRASASVALYLLAGFAGLPIFANGGGGMAAFASPSAGYLLGFLPFAFVAGSLGYLFTRKLSNTAAIFGARLGANLIGFALLTTCGIIGLMVNAHMPFEKAWVVAIAFVPWDLVKSTLAVLVALSVHRAFPALARL